MLWSKEVLARSITELQVSPSVIRALARAGIDSMVQILLMDEEDIRHIKGLGSMERLELLSQLAQLENEGEAYFKQAEPPIVEQDEPSVIEKAFVQENEAEETQTANNEKRRIKWDIYEAALLLDMYLQIQDKAIERAEGIAHLSQVLRKKATLAGLEIDDIYRNENGMSMQLGCMEYVLTNGRKGLSNPTKLYYEIVQIYRNVPERYGLILEKARRMIGESVAEAQESIQMDLPLKKRDDETPTKQNEALDVTGPVNVMLPEARPPIYEDTAQEGVINADVGERIWVNAGPGPEEEKRYANILAEHFEEGYRLSSAIDRGRFALFFEEAYGAAPTEEDEALDAVVKRAGTSRNGRVYPRDEGQQDELTQRILQELNATFADGASCIYMETVFERYEKPLAEVLKIYSLDALEDFLCPKLYYMYSRSKKYLYYASKTPDPKDDVLRCFRESHAPLSYEALKEKLWYIPSPRVKREIAAIKPVVNVGSVTWFYAPNLPFSEEERQRIVDTLSRRLESDEYVTDGEFLTILEEQCPSVILNAQALSDTGLCSVLAYLLHDEFSFSRGKITRLGLETNWAEEFADFCSEHERATLDEIKDRLPGQTMYYWNVVYDRMVRISEEEFVRKDQIAFDTDAADSVLDTLCDGEYIPLRKVELFSLFPRMEIPWNVFLLECFVRGYSKCFRMVQQGILYGAVVRRDSGIRDYRDLILAALSHSDAWQDTDSALQFLVREGYQQRRIYSDIDAVVREARMRRDNLR